MRLGTFIMGGLVGAAAVMYFNGKKKPMMMSTWSSASDAVSKIVGQSRSKMNQSNGKSVGGSASSHDSVGLDKVESILNENPNVKFEVDKIMKENEQAPVM